LPQHAEQFEFKRGWVVENTPFDRLYFYADDRPIHVSVGPENKREVVWMRKGKSGRLIPRVVGVDSFLRMSGDDL
jgi:hypothetical protein